MKRFNDSSQAQANVNRPNPTSGGERGAGPRRKKRQNFVLPLVLVAAGCVVFSFAAWSAVNSPALASILSSPEAAVPQSRPSFAQVEIPKPSTNNSQPPAQEQVDIVPTLAMTPITQPTVEVVGVIPTNIPTLEPTALPTNTIAPTANVAETPGVAYVEIVPDTPTSQYVAPTTAPYVPPVVGGSGGAHWLDVDLSNQRLYAYAGDTMVNSFIVSTGTWQTPTVTGSFKVWVKLRFSDMSGPGYYLPDVPYVMYFFKDYGIHGTYWHNNFGTPMSHGCVNLSIADAEWVYNFSSVGTVVNVHY